MKKPGNLNGYNLDDFKKYHDVGYEIMKKRYLRKMIDNITATIIKSVMKFA
jgi:hypothetical protein